MGTARKKAYTRVSDLRVYGLVSRKTGGGGACPSKGSVARTDMLTSYAGKEGLGSCLS